MTDFVNQSQPFGSVPQVPNEFATAQLETAILTDPVQIQAFKQSIADQMNAQSGGPTLVDLSDRIADIKIETAAQGASILTVSVIDPLWVLLVSGFIQADAEGYLWPPIDVNFPTGTDCVWRLAAVEADWDAEMDMQNGNLTLTFEDRIASLLREMSAASPGGLSQGQANQTLGGFFKQLVDNANSVLHLKKGERIRLVEMISPQDPNYTPPINDVPASATSSLHKQAVRKDPLKQKTGLASEQQTQINFAQLMIAKMFGREPGSALAFQSPVGETFSLTQIEQQALPIIGLRPDGSPIFGH